MNHTCLIRTLPKICSPVTVQGSRSAIEDDVTVYINKGNGAQIRSRKPVSSLLKFSNHVYFLTRFGSVRNGQGINKSTDKKKGAKATQITYLTQISFVLRKLAMLKVM